MNELTLAVTDFLKLIDDPLRFEIIKLLKNRKMNAKEIEDALEISQSYTSQQLNLLLKGNLIDFKRDEEKIKHYFIKDKNIFNVFNTIQSFVLERQKLRYEQLFDANKLDMLRF
ncbi:MAG: ArsR family transcriptional regulator [Promethearchaeota archaeon]|nr:MAG: ArsR family transcriptional regulator [Candidatus Lokiarchaeota archaeon]